MKDQQFYDNADASLSLPKRVTYRSDEMVRLQKRQQTDKEQYLRENGIANETDLARVVPRNVGAHDEIGARMQKYVEAGYDTLTAIAAAEQEIEEDQAEPEGDYLGASVEDLMRASVQPDHRGSRSRSKRGGGERPDPLQAEYQRHFQRTRVA